MIYNMHICVIYIYKYTHIYIWSMAFLKSMIIPIALEIASGLIPAVTFHSCHLTQKLIMKCSKAIQRFNGGLSIRKSNKRNKSCSNVYHMGF